MKLWLTRQASGAYMLTAIKPIICKVDGMPFADAYTAPGEPVGLRHICPLILKVIGIDAPQKLIPVQVELTGGAVP